MIIKGAPFTYLGDQITVSELSALYKKSVNRSHVSFRTMIRLSRISGQTKMLQCEYRTKLCIVSEGWAFRESTTASHFFTDEKNKHFEYLNLLLSGYVRVDKMRPKILSQHIFHGKFGAYEDFFSGRYAPEQWYVKGMGSSEVNELVDPFDIDCLNQRQLKHVNSRHFWGDQLWKVDRDPWANYLMIANILVVRVVGQRKGQLGDFWLYVPNVPEQSVNDAVVDACALVEERGFDIVFVSDPVPQRREEEYGGGSAWLHFDNPIDDDRMKILLKQMKYIDEFD